MITRHNARTAPSRYAAAAILIVSFATAHGAEGEGTPRWYKGNTHTHTWWSDGDSPPELAVGWYREHGYHFLAISDHNTMNDGEKWVDVSKAGRADAAKTYEAKFGADWIVKREREGKTEYRLKTLDEYRSRFEKPGEFLLIPGEEISDSFEKKPIHVNAINLKQVIPPPHGKSFFETVQNNVNAVLEQRKRTGQPMFPHVNHPNFGWAFTIEDFFELKGEQFFEVYNGHPGVNNRGNEKYPSTERMWDVLLTKRLAEYRLPVMYGIATDDAHGFTAYGKGKSNPGRGWVMVRATRLTPESIIEAMERGDFYASTGVELEDVHYRSNTLEIRIKGKPGETYRTEFVGTRKGYDPGSTSQPAEAGERVSRQYSDTIGVVLAEVEGTSARYTLKGDEIYVRAKVTSSKVHENPSAPPEFEVAWTQPVVPGPSVGAAR